MRIVAVGLHVCGTLLGNGGQGGIALERRKVGGLPLLIDQAKYGIYVW